jgi:hypothetical protein
VLCIIQKNPNEFKKGGKKGRFLARVRGVTSSSRVQKRRGEKGGSSRERAARAYMHRNTQNIPIVNMYLAVLWTQRALIGTPFAASSQGMHGQTSSLKRGAQRCNRPGERTFQSLYNIIFLKRENDHRTSFHTFHEAKWENDDRYLSGPTLLSRNIAVPIFSHYDCPYMSSQGKKYVRTASSHTICLSPQKKRTAISICARIRTCISLLFVGNDCNSLRKI